MSPDFNPQAAFEQVTQRLDALQTSHDEMKQVLIQTVDIQTGMLGSLQQMQTAQAEMQATQNQMQTAQAEMQATQQQMQATQNQMQTTQQQMQRDIQQLQNSHLQLLKVQNQMLDYMKFTFDQQAKWNERQDQFNIIFLDELRELRREMRQRDDSAQNARDEMYNELKTRIVKLEDFMNDQLRKAS